MARRVPIARVECRDESRREGKVCSSEPSIRRPEGLGGLSLLSVHQIELLGGDSRNSKECDAPWRDRCVRVRQNGDHWGVQWNAGEDCRPNGPNGRPECASSSDRKRDSTEQNVDQRDSTRNAAATAPNSPQKSRPAWVVTASAASPAAPATMMRIEVHVPSGGSAARHRGEGDRREDQPPQRSHRRAARRRPPRRHKGGATPKPRPSAKARCSRVLRRSRPPLAPLSRSAVRDRNPLRQGQNHRGGPGG